MEQFNRLYLWGSDTKHRMGIYFSAIVFCKGVTGALMGQFSIDSLVLLEMMLVCFLFAGLETGIFPETRNRSGEISGRRIALWAVLGNVLCIGGSWIFHWFPGLPPWGTALLIAVLEAGLLSMWYVIKLSLKRDTDFLNQSLRRFQERQDPE